MKIYPIAANSVTKKISNNNNSPVNNEPVTKNSYNNIVPQFNDNLVFTARVDKGLERFYDTNKDKMPERVRIYIEGLPSKRYITPLEAQQQAYSYLSIADSIDDIKGIYPEFADLKNPEESRATNGILYSMRENAELLELMGQDTLKDKSNLTVYLVKKIYLDNKTLEEINTDLENDLNSDFVADFRFRNGETAPFIRTSTLKALGIQGPDMEYRTSLRFTRDGYSDFMGEKISAAQRAMWEAMPPEERTAKARKTVEKFENWWNSIPRTKKLEMISEQMDELAMLSKYKEDNPNSSRNHSKRTPVPEVDIPEYMRENRTKTKVGSNTLSQDDLFKIWASNNLKIFEAGLSDKDLEEIKAIRTARRIQKWQEMTPAEKTQYLNELKVAHEPLRYTMIDAWNNSFDIIVALSDFLTKKHVELPVELLYSSDQFKDFQSRVMTEFWAINPNFGRELGDHIIHSQGKIRRAINSGEFENLKKVILKEKKQRIKELQKFKLEKAKSNIPIQQKKDIPEYMQEFVKAYYRTLSSQVTTTPPSYTLEYFEIIQKAFPPEVINSWTKNLKREHLTPEDIKNLEYIKNTEPPEAAYINRPFELVGSEILYDMTGSTLVYGFSFSDIKVALSQIYRGEKNIDIISTKLGNKRITIPVNKPHINIKEFEKIYKMFRAPISDYMAKALAESYFDSKDGDYTSLVNYLKTYGQGLSVIFLDTSFHPHKNLLINNVLRNMPENIADNYTCIVRTPEQQLRDSILTKSAEIFLKTHKNLPDVFLDEYIRGINSNMRRDDNLKLTKPNLIIYDKKHLLKNQLKLEVLAMESALADCLYASTGDNNVYGLELEDLNSLIIESSAIKKYPETYMIAEILDGKQSSVPITFKRKVIQGNLERKYNDYIEDIKDRQKSLENPWDIEELICALNPDENNQIKDEILKNKILKYQVEF